MLPVDATVFGWAVASVAIWLIGCNASIVKIFWPERWLTIKMIGCSALLGYVAYSALYEHPTTNLLIAASVAVAIDGSALNEIWSAMKDARAGDGVLVAYRRR